MYDRDDKKVTLTHRPRFVTTDMAALRTAALAGVGIGQLPLLMIREQLASGSLHKLLSDWSPRRDIIHAVFPSQRGLLPSVRSLIDHLAERYASFDED